MIGIYKIENKVNGKVYIGQSVDINRRWNDHKSSIYKEELSHLPLYRAFVKYGIENFLFSVIEECSREELNDKEIEYIYKYSSSEERFGYNLSIGGQNNYNKDSLDRSLNIKEEIINSDKNLTQIADEFGVSFRTVSSINSGEIWFDDNLSYPLREYAREKKVCFCSDCGVEITSRSTRCRDCYYATRRKIERPSPEALLELVATQGFSETGRLLGVTGNSIKKWLKGYDLPFLIDDVKKLYGNYIEPSTKNNVTNYSKKIIEVTLNGEVLEVNNIDDLIDYVIKNNLSTAKRENIRSGIQRVILGRRQSYLSMKIIEIQ